MNAVDAGAVVSSPKHTPGRPCAVCERACRQPATIDEASTALAVAATRLERLVACEALAAAAQAEVKRLRNAARGSDAL